MAEFDKITHSGSQGPPLISHEKYLAMVRHFDRDSVIRGAAWASSLYEGNIVVDGRPVAHLPWNTAGLAITAICRGTVGGRAPTSDELTELIRNFGRVADDLDEGDGDAAMRALSRVFYQQTLFQLDDLHEWSRAHALFVDTPFPADRTPEVMGDGWAEALLDASVEEYCATGFILWASAKSVFGEYHPGVWDSTMSGFLELMSIDRIHAIAEKNFVSDIPSLKLSRRAVQDQIQGPEEYGYNPLIAKPLLRDVIRGSWLAPSSELVASKASSVGIVYSGIEKWEERFTRDLGHLFQAYVGRHLALIDGATIIGEIDVGTPQAQKMTADWVVVLDEHVLIVEVKASSATEGMRQAVGDLFLKHTEKLSKAIGQINDTVTAIRQRRDLYGGVPIDRPIVGFVVTLGNFPDVGFAYDEIGMGTAGIPIGFLSSGDLEHFVGHSKEEVNCILNDGLRTHTKENFLDARSMLRGSSRSFNKIIDDAWFSNPLLAYLRSRQTY